MQMRQDQWTDEEWDALCNAAPDLLAALKRLTNDPVVRVTAENEERFAAILDSAHAAIAKAEAKPSIAEEGEILVH